MTVVVVGLVAGVVGGLGRGGRVRNLSAVRLDSIWLLVAGAAGQGVAVLTALRGKPGLGLVVTSHLALAAFAGRNLARVGMGVVLFGVALNLAPILIDHGMPVEGSAIVRAQVATADEIPLLGFGAKRHLAHRGDKLRILDDRIPDWLTREVLSFGDLAIGAGVAAVMAGLLGGKGAGSGPFGPRRSRLRLGRRSSAGGSPVADLDRPATG